MRLTIWLLLLFFVAHYGYDFAPNRYAAFTMMLGAVSAILAWMVRGPRRRARWWVCLLACIEGWQVFLCQGAQNWTDVNLARFHGACEAFLFGLPMYAWGMGAWAVVAGFVASEASNGHRPPDG